MGKREKKGHSGKRAKGQQGKKAKGQNANYIEMLCYILRMYTFLSFYESHLTG